MSGPLSLVGAPGAPGAPGTPDDPAAVHLAGTADGYRAGAAGRSPVAAGAARSAGLAQVAGGFAAPGTDGAGGTIPRPPQTAPPRRRRAPSWAVREPIAELAERLSESCAVAVHPDEIAAVLESEGLTDEQITGQYGHADLFALAATLFAYVPRAYPEPEPAADPWATDVWRCVLRGLTFALPGVAYVLGGRWADGPDGPFGVSRAVAAWGAAALCGWGWNQALAHRAHLLLLVQRPRAAARCLLTGASSGAALATAAAACVTGFAQPGALVFAAGQSLYVSSATVLLVLGRERSLLHVLTPLTLAVCCGVTSLPAPAVAAVLAGTVLAAAAAALSALVRTTSPARPAAAWRPWFRRVRPQPEAAAEGGAAPAGRFGRLRTRAGMPGNQADGPGTPGTPASRLRRLLTRTPEPNDQADTPATPATPASRLRRLLTRTPGPDGDRSPVAEAVPRARRLSRRLGLLPGLRRCLRLRPGGSRWSLTRNPPRPVADDQAAADILATPASAPTPTPTVRLRLPLPRKPVPPVTDGRANTPATGRPPRPDRPAGRRRRPLSRRPVPPVADGRANTPATGRPPRRLRPGSLPWRAKAAAERGRAVQPAGGMRGARLASGVGGLVPGLVRAVRRGAYALAARARSAGIALRTLWRAQDAEGSGGGVVSPYVVLPQGVAGLAAGTLVIAAALTGEFVAALTVSMGIAEWLLFRIRSRCLVALRRTGVHQRLVTRSWRVLALCLVAYGAALVALAAVEAVALPGAAALSVPHLGVLLALGSALWLTLLLQSCGRPWAGAGLLAAAAASAVVLLGVHVATPGAVLGLVCAGATAVLLAAACTITGRVTTHR